MSEVEEWKDYKVPPYRVSNLGRVRGVHGVILTPRVGAHGYLKISVCDGSGLPQDHYINRMVAETFIGPPPHADSQAAYLDHNITNNKSSNLQWMSPHEARARRNIAKGERSGQAKLSEEQVRDIRSRPKMRGTHRALAKEFGVSREQIRDIINMKYWKSL